MCIGYDCFMGLQNVFDFQLIKGLLSRSDFRYQVVLQTMSILVLLGALVTFFLQGDSFLGRK